ncbi:hypothetical protein DA075_09955 [Methylobacterium currus]|uniref:Uncharacterized protein n=1 Tax=Methylobacterium currus TaxID=2051553 RepID=A0A2R4WI44_9HYPH|nr:hypothetical protein [Methylobacterium currus]AWB21196.1 hypothetical protein DA075_09955 [Methylobacterium currus]
MAALTPALQNVLRILVQAKEPHNYPSLAALLGRPERSLHGTVTEIRQALEGTGVAIQVAKRGREAKARITVIGDPKTIATLIEEVPGAGQPHSRYVKAVTLPSILGKPYTYTPEGRLTVGGELQPVRAA